MAIDCIVIGAGISGASTAYHLKRAGASHVLLLERGEAASGGTGKSAAIIRQSYSTPLLVRLARESIGMLARAKDELGRDAGFVRAGYCFLFSREMLDGARRNVAMQRALGVINEWSEGAGFPERLPDLNPDGVAAIVHEPDGGYADPVSATEAYLHAFQALGGEFRPHAGAPAPAGWRPHPWRRDRRRPDPCASDGKRRGALGEAAQRERPIAPAAPQRS